MITVRRWQGFLGMAILAIGLLALASYVTTGILWDGGFPSGQFRIKVRNAEGAPVQGAVLHIYRGGTRAEAFGYPIDNHIEGADLASDSKGVIKAMRDSENIQFGGFCWELFWVIPMGVTSGPKYDVEITAEGYKPAKFEIWRLFKSPYTYYADFPKAKIVVKGKEIELKIYSQKIVLEK